MIVDIVRNQTIRLDEYQPHPRNYQNHPPAQIAKLAASLRKFGQIRSVVVWRKYFLAGHGVQEAARSLGWQTLRADVVDESVSEDTALAYVVADNELAKQSDPDQAALAAILQGLSLNDTELVEAAGFNMQEVEDLLAQLGPPNLNALATKHGEPQERDFWPYIHLQVSPETQRKYLALLESLPGNDEAEKFDALVSG